MSVEQKGVTVPRPEEVTPFGWGALLQAERFMRTVKYEEIYLADYQTLTAATRLNQSLHRRSVQP